MGSTQPPKLSYLSIERLAISNFDYRAYNGDAPRDYPATWTQLPWACRQAKWTIRGGPLEAQFSYDGSEIGNTRVLRASCIELDSFIFFRVRTLVPGFLSWYQLIAMR